ncbi:MAG: hypothetical protein KGN34_12445 [Sphingomonadales bacterium]|nr:hypothetical protein [Sphingomonadales bacterium]
MDLDTLLHHYFATDDLAALDEATLARGCEQLGIDFGVETEPSRKFALWVLMDALGIAPPPAEAFDEESGDNAPALRAAADDWLRQTYRLTRD